MGDRGKESTIHSFLYEHGILYITISVTRYIEIYECSDQRLPLLYKHLGGPVMLWMLKALLSLLTLHCSTLQCIITLERVTCYYGAFEKKFKVSLWFTEGVRKLSGPETRESVLDIGGHINLGTWQSTSTATELHTGHQSSHVPPVVQSPPPTTRKQISGKLGSSVITLPLYYL